MILIILRPPDMNLTNFGNAINATGEVVYRLPFMSYRDSLVVILSFLWHLLADQVFLLMNRR